MNNNDDRWVVLVFDGVSVFKEANIIFKNALCEMLYDKVKTKYMSLNKYISNTLDFFAVL